MLPLKTRDIGYLLAQILNNFLSKMLFIGHVFIQNCGFLLLIDIIQTNPACFAQVASSLLCRVLKHLRAGFFAVLTKLKMGLVLSVSLVFA